MSNKNGIHHVVYNPDNKIWPKTTLCGKEVWRHDMPIDIEHAKACVEQGTYLQPCKKCMKKAPKEQE
ncbi:MAG: hypothetical protein ACRCVV_10535 [Shewanella sp.]